MPQSNAVGFDGSGGFGGSFYAAYKHTYGPKRIEPLVYRNRPFLRDARKVDDFEGDSYMHSILFDDPDTGSVTISNALNQGQVASQSARFAIWRGHEYQTLNLSAEEVRAARSDAGSLLRKKDYETRRVIDRMSYRIDIGLHNGGSGILASFTTGNAASNAASTITLDTNAMCVRFAVGMILQGSTTNPTDGTPAALMNGGATAVVTAINRSSVPGIPSTITVNQTLNTWLGSPATTTQFFLLRAGDGVGFGQNVLNGGVCGLKCWLPAPPPIGTPFTTRLSPTDSFWGYNRNVDPQRLAGCTYQAQPGEKYQVTFQNAGQELYINGGGNDQPGTMKLYVAPADYNGYSQELGPQVRYADTNKGAAGFADLHVRTMAGDMTLTADPQLEPGLFYMLDTSTYHIKTLDAMPHMDEQDGLTGLRLSGADAQQIRWRSWHQLIFDEPGRNLVGRCV